jgi:glycosyltransferase involved in cell wall biosynthesis
MLRFATLLESELQKRGHTVRLLQPQPILGNDMYGHAGLGKWLGYVDKFLLFPRKLSSIKSAFDVVHICDHSNAMYTSLLRGIPHVVTCHDLLAIKSALGEVPQNPVRPTGRQFQRMIVDGLKQAQRVICDSENTRLELLRITARPPESVSRVYLGLNYPYSPMETRKALALLEEHHIKTATPFIIHVGGNQWYKNRLGVLHIFNQLRRHIPLSRLQLLMVGPPASESMRRFIKERDLGGAVQLVTGVSNEVLRAAYSLAQALIFPSLEEGFGWPILEAQACGCPVFTTGRAPMTELGGTAAVYFNPSAEEDAANCISNSLSKLDNLRRLGLENVKRFQEATMIHEYLDAYEQVASEKVVH